MPERIQRAAAAALVCSAFAALPACTAVPEPTVGQYIDDAAITTAVKARYIDDAQVDAADVEVTTVRGVVMLSGFADDARERAAAEAIAREVKGVAQVVNEIAVRPAQ